MSEQPYSLVSDTYQSHQSYACTRGETARTRPQGLQEPMNKLLTHDLYENHPYDLPSHFQPPCAAALAELSQAVLKVAVPLAT